MKKLNVGVIGLGAYIPEQGRTNSWGASEGTAGWEDKLPKLLSRFEGGPTIPKTRGAEFVRDAQRELESDLFQGAIERRVLAEDKVASDMEASAAVDAIKAAGIERKQIDLLLLSTLVPDYLNVNSAAIVHQK